MNIEQRNVEKRQQIFITDITGFKVSRRCPATVVAWIIIIIIMRTIKIIMMMVVVVSNVEIFVIIGCLLVSKSKQIDAREMIATHVSVWFPIVRGPIRLEPCSDGHIWQ